MTNPTPTRWLSQPLTQQQTEILKHYLAGWQPADIAAKFQLRPRDLYNTLNTIQAKFNAPTRSIMIALALYDNLFSFTDLLPLTIAATYLSWQRQSQEPNP